MIDILMPTIAQGLLWAIMALGVYITFRVLDIADLTVEGSFPLGAAVAAAMLSEGYSVSAAFACAAVAGMLAGVATGFLHTKLKIPALTGLDNVYTVLAVGAVSALICVIFIYWFFGTEIGAAIRATGYNQQMIRAQGVDTRITIILGLLISNALVALSGALIAQNNGFADVGMGTGTIVIGLASVIIGEVLFGTRSFKNCLISVVLGSVVYRIVIAAVLQMGMPPNDLKLFTALLVAFALSLPLVKDKVGIRKAVK